MSMSVDVLKFDWKTIVDQIVNNGCDNRHVVEEVLEMFGEKICDKYVILLDDHRVEDEFHRMCHTIESLFGIEDCFGVVYDLDFDYVGGYYSDKAIEKEEELAELLKMVEVG